MDQHLKGMVQRNKAALKAKGGTQLMKWPVAIFSLFKNGHTEYDIHILNDADDELLAIPAVC